VQIFDQVANLATGAPPLVSLTGVFSGPVSIAVGAGGDFWVADISNSKMFHFQSVPNLPLANNASDTSLLVLGPHSGFVDSFNHLVVSDGINRILYFVPQVNVTNSANYSTRALTAGTAVSLFPTVTTNPVANGTATAPAQFPIPATLADTQITVGGTPTPLLYVSPSQDNIILPQALATSGSADLQVIRPSTGQIVAAAEIELASASPGLFTQGSVGSGQVAAINVQDSTVNGYLHPAVRGQYVSLYGTGVGPVANAPADGTAASGQPASDFPVVLIASSNASSTGGTLAQFLQATVTFSGLAPGFAGLWQINVQIPQQAQSGSAVVIKVYENDIPNLDQSSALTTTLAIQ
jgi:uncharacterized protein (TIGR03437 family)